MHEVDPEATYFYIPNPINTNAVNALISYLSGDQSAQCLGNEKRFEFFFWGGGFIIRRAQSCRSRKAQLW